MRPALILLALAIALSGACARPAARDLLARRSELIDPRLIRSVLEKAPVESTQAFRPQTLLVTEQFSAHLLQFRTQEERHIHMSHDLTLLVHRGRGEIHVNDRRYLVQPGDVFHIPRGTPHSCVNTGAEPLVTVNVFTPPYDGKDSIPVPRAARSYPREPESSP